MRTRASNLERAARVQVEGQQDRPEPVKSAGAPSEAATAAAASAESATSLKLLSAAVALKLRQSPYISVSSEHEKAAVRPTAKRSPNGIDLRSYQPDEKSERRS